MTEEMVKDGRNLRRQKSADRIYAAAMKLLETHSYEDLAVEDICAEAEVGRATFFRVFGGKEGLLREINIRIAAKVRENLPSVAKGDLVTKLNLVGEQVALTWSEAAPGALSLVLEYSRTAKISDAHDVHSELLEEVIGIVEQAIKDGELVSSFPAEYLGSVAMTHMAVTAAFWAENSQLDLHTIMQEAVSSWAFGHIHAQARK